MECGQIGERCDELSQFSDIEFHFLRCICIDQSIKLGTVVDGYLIQHELQINNIKVQNKYPHHIKDESHNFEDKIYFQHDE